MEVVTQSGADQPEILFGWYDRGTNTVRGGISIPGLDSWLAGGNTDTYVTGLAEIPADQQPSNVNVVHWAFDIMVGIGTLLMLLAIWFAIAYWRRRDVPHSKLFLWAAASAGVFTYVAVEAGWIVTEVGRQPWIVYGILRTEDAVTHGGRNLGQLHDRRAPLHNRSVSRPSWRCAPCRGGGGATTRRRTTPSRTARGPPSRPIPTRCPTPGRPATRRPFDDHR